MTVLAAGFRVIDVRFQDVPGAIAAVLLHTSEGAVVIDPGPTSSLPAFTEGATRAGTDIGDVTAILLTHIHLDHAGATGTLVQQNPRIRVYVHERGAPHLQAPQKLLESATRLYGDAMDRLWGAFLPVPGDSITALRGGERLRFGARELEVAYTPGHASHHVSYFDPETRIAFVGDVGGVRLAADPFVLPPTPPPDIDVEAWKRSVATLLAWRPETLFMTHFGSVGQPELHLQRLIERLDVYAAHARATLDLDGSDADREAAFSEMVRRDLKQALGSEAAARYELVVPLQQAWMGLARYWRKRMPAAS